MHSVCCNRIWVKDVSTLLLSVDSQKGDALALMLQNDEQTKASEELHNQHRSTDGDGLWNAAWYQRLDGEYPGETGSE